MVDPGGKQGGPLHFWDPRPAHGAAASVWRALEPAPLAGVDFAAGLMLLFPSWLEHSVPQHSGKRPRITISFNIAAYWQKGVSRGFVEAYPKSWAAGRSAASGLPISRQRHDLWASPVVHGRGDPTSTWLVVEAAERTASATSPAAGGEVASCSAEAGLVQGCAAAGVAPRAALGEELGGSLCEAIRAAAGRALASACGTSCADSPVLEMEALLRGGPQELRSGQRLPAGRQQPDATLRGVVLLRSDWQAARAAPANSMS